MAKVVIFGTGAAGRAIYRAIKDKDDIVAFIDNSPSKINTFYKGIKIIAPAELKKLNFDAVLIGGVWADEMSAQLLNLGISKEKIKLIDDKDISYSADNRAKTTNYYVKSLVGILDELGYDYFIDGSGLLSILRKRELSVVSDVDIMLFENKSLSNLANILPQVFPELNIEIRYCQKDYAARKKGDIFNIIISDNSEEKMVLDINAYDKYKNFYTLPYNEKYFYIPKEFLDELISLDYKDFKLKAPKRYDEYLSLVYGKNYLEIPKQFLANDYGNLVDFQTLKKL
ncbi:nucleoside-diphosphate sugar epimerase/dehydratase [Campylobacter magnus]|uniref:nucleoside-diphosphate sugar epimerase/dehydratase n=1 Tax=Campylobacter magnus TaxID=3026462 RepID=UPI00235F10E4|nr:hypothetical protein [Campylobacter magnus]MDD0856042.1 hypothetical protein [Campylobacter magnus]